MSEDKKPESVEKSKGGATEEQQAKAQELQNADPKAQTTSEPSDAPAAEVKGPSDEEKEAKAKRAAEARAARAKAKAEKEAESQAEEEAPKEPSPNQPRLDRIVELIKQDISEEAIEEAFINEVDSHRPYLVIKSEYWLQTAELLVHSPELKLDYLRNLSGVDQETHMEVVYHLISIESQHEYVFKVRTDREAPSVPSVTPTWATANWNEREAYDLLGIDFPGHPDLRRIMMSDDWVGHPLRKDYEPIDPEV